MAFIDDLRAALASRGHTGERVEELLLQVGDRFSPERKARKAEFQSALDAERQSQVDFNESQEFSVGRFLKQQLAAGGQGGANVLTQIGRLAETPPTDILVDPVRGLFEKLGVPMDQSEEFARTTLGPLSGPFTLGGGLDTLPGGTDLRKRAGRAVRLKGRALEGSAAEIREGIGGGPWSEALGDVTSTIVGSAPSLAASFTPAGIIGPIIAGGLQSYAGMVESQYDARIERGDSEEDAVRGALLPAIVAGAVTGVLTKMMPGGTERLAGNLARHIADGTITKGSLRAALKTTGVEAIKEWPEEAFDEAAQGIITKVTVEPDKPWEEIAYEAIYAGGVGTIVAGGIGGVRMGVKAAVGNRKSIDEPVDAGLQPPPIPEVPRGTEAQTTLAKPAAVPVVPVLNGPLTEKRAKELFAKLQVKRKPANDLETFLTEQYAAGNVSGVQDVLNLTAALTVGQLAQPAPPAAAPAQLPSVGEVHLVLARAAVRNQPDKTRSIDEGYGKALANTYTRGALQSAFGPQTQALIDAGVFTPKDNGFVLVQGKLTERVADLDARGFLKQPGKVVTRINTGPPIPEPAAAKPVRPTKFLIRSKATGTPGVEVDRIVVYRNPNAGKVRTVQPDPVADSYGAVTAGQPEGEFSVVFNRGSVEVGTESFHDLAQAASYGRFAAQRAAGVDHSIEEVAWNDTPSVPVGRANRQNVLVAGRNMLARAMMVRNPSPDQINRLNRLRNLVDRGDAQSLAAVLGLTLDANAEGLPAEFAFVRPPTTTAKESRDPSPGRPPSTVQTPPTPIQAKTKADQEEQRQGGATRQGLTAAEAANWTGGELVVIPWMPQIGPLEVLTEGETVTVVRQLSTGRSFEVAAGSIQTTAEFRSFSGRRVYIPKPWIGHANLPNRLSYMSLKDARRIWRMNADQARAALKETEQRRDGLMKEGKHGDDLAAALERIELLKRQLAELKKGGVRSGQEEEVQTQAEADAIRGEAVNSVPAADTENASSDGFAEPVEAAGITYSPPLDRRDTLISNALVAAWARAKAMFPMIQIGSINWVQGTKDTDPFMWTEVGGDVPVVHVHLDRLVRRVKDMTVPQMERYVRKIVQEESIHMASALALQADWEREGGLGTGMNLATYIQSRYQKMYEDMTPEQRAAAHKTYGHESQWLTAAEFARQIVQSRIDGVTTEESIGVRFIEFLNSVLRMLNEMISVVKTGTVRNALLEHVLAIEEIIQQADLSRALAKAGMSERSGRILPTRLIPVVSPADTSRATITAPVRPIPERLTSQLRSDPGYAYHATNLERVYGIAESGLSLHSPSAYTDQSAWPDNSTEQRAYFTQNASIAWHFAPEDGTPVVVRVRLENHPLYTEDTTGDMFSRSVVPPASLEVLTEGGEWRPVTELLINRDVVPAMEHAPLLASGLAPLAQGTALRPGQSTDLTGLTITALQGQRNPQILEESGGPPQSPDEAGWFTTLNLETALRQANGPAGQVARVQVTLGKARLINAGGMPISEFTGELKRLRDQGYDGAIIQDAVDHGGVEPEVHVVFNPENIQPLKVEAAEPVRLAARVVNKREWDQQFFAVNQLSAAKARELHIATMAQLQAAGMFARGQFESLPDGAKGFLKPYSDRLAAMEESAKATGIDPATLPTTLAELVPMISEEMREPAVLDAWQNVHDLIEYGIKLARGLDISITTLEKLQANPPARDVKPIAERALNAYKGELIKARNAAAKSGQSVRSFISEIQRVDSTRVTMDADTPISKVIAGLFQNPDITTVDYAGLNISATEADFLRSVLTATGQPAMDKLIGGALEKAQDRVTNMSDALAFLRTTIDQNPDFIANLQYFADNLNVRAEVLREDLTHYEIKDPITDTWVGFNFSTDAGVPPENEVKLLQLLGNIDAWLDSDAAKNNPIVRAGYEAQRYNIQNIYLSPAWKAESGHQMTSDWNIYHIGIKLLGSTPEYALEGQTTLAAHLGMIAVQNRNQALRLTGKFHREHGAGIEKAAAKAALAHKMDRRLWLDEVINPLVNSLQENGAVEYKVGDMLNGRKILPEDMKAVDLMHAFVRDVITGLQTQETTWNRAKPAAKIYLVDRAFEVSRKAMATGLRTMPKFFNKDMSEIAENIAKAATLKDWIGSMRRLLTGFQFKTVVVSHLRTVSRGSVSYSASINSPFRAQYLAATKMVDNGDPKAPDSMNDLVDLVFDGYNASRDADVQMSRSDVEIQIFRELIQMAKKFHGTIKEMKIEGQPGERVSIVSSNNFISRPREEQIAPDSFYVWHTITPNDQYQLLNAVDEVYANRVWEALKAVQDELGKGKARFEEKISAMVSAGMDRAKATSKLQKQTSKLQLKGEELYTYNETVFHMRMTAKRIKALESVKESPVGDELHTFSRALRRLIVSGLLNVPAIVGRNLLGGILGKHRTMHAMFDHDKTLARLVFRVPSLAVDSVKMTFDIGKSIIRMFGTDYLSYQFMQGTKGKAIKAALESNPDFYAGLVGGWWRLVMQEAQTYERLLEFGIAGNSRWKHRVQNLWYNRNEGGRFRAEKKSPDLDRKAMFWLETILGGVFELGLNSGAPADVLTRRADQIADGLAMNMADGVIKKLEGFALQAMARRSDLGLLGYTDQLTPQELLGHKAATGADAEFTRVLFRKANINIDLKAVEYYRAVQEARRAGTDPSQVTMLDNVEIQSFRLVLANEANRSGYANRPETTHQTELGRWAMLFYGYPAWLNTRYALARSRFSKVKKGTSIEGHVNTMNWLTVTFLMGFVAEENARTMSHLLYNEERQSQNPLRAESVSEFAMDTLAQSGPLLPVMAGIMNYATESVKPGSGLLGTGMQLVPISLINDIFAFGRAITSHGSPTRPAISFLTKWDPNLKILTKLLPFNTGMVEIRNANRIIRSNFPPGIEYQKFSGNSFAFTLGSTADNKDNVLAALAKPDGIDWEVVRRQREIGINELREKGHKDPEGSFDRSVRARNPFEVSAGRKLGTAERDSIFKRMNEAERELVLRVENVFRAYASDTGRPDWSPLPADEVRSSRAAPVAVMPPLRQGFRQTPIRGVFQQNRSDRFSSSP